MSDKCRHESLDIIEMNYPEYADLKCHYCGDIIRLLEIKVCEQYEEIIKKGELAIERVEIKHEGS